MSKDGLHIAETDPEEIIGTSNMVENLRISNPKPAAKSTVRRASTLERRSSTMERRTSTVERHPSTRRPKTKRRSSGYKQPLGVDMSFGNSPSTVRQFRRVSDKGSADSGYASHYQLNMDENSSPTMSVPEQESKEARLGRRAYSKGIGLVCQDVLGTTADQEKRDAIAKLAEAWSDLEMVDPEGVYHILRGMNEKFHA